MSQSIFHEVLTAVFGVRGLPDGAPRLSVLLWERGLDPQAGTWSLPGGLLDADEDLRTSARRQLAEKVDLRQVAHIEQLSVFSAPDRMPGPRVIASTYLALVRPDSVCNPPTDTRWHPVDALPVTSFDHGAVVESARRRLAAKLSYTNIAFALAPTEFSMSTLSDIYGAALGYPVDSTNLLRILSRRGVVVATGTTGPTGRSGGRPPALYRFTDTGLRVTDEFATLRPPP
ncbi:NUDIX hydrolase [Williamsia deligens]|uniref:NUDIX domain-containing protein n=1 Tax=Williamsia deligens TaxID=321325 RepID=A0ABW3GBX8_9NOCA|nr:NUDIX domain-containing protein [Williamsia deligens]MCP2195913.1 ADP-ribose pyrophosphatase YjhB, NUDIX family [Williamsia deligens]